MPPEPYTPKLKGIELSKLVTPTLPPAPRTSAREGNWDRNKDRCQALLWLRAEGSFRTFSLLFTFCQRPTLAKLQRSLLNIKSAHHMYNRHDFSLLIQQCTGRTFTPTKETSNNSICNRTKVPSTWCYRAPTTLIRGCSERKWCSHYSHTQWRTGSLCWQNSQLRTRGGFLKV